MVSQFRCCMTQDYGLYDMDRGQLHVELAPDPLPVVPYYPNLGLYQPHDEHCRETSDSAAPMLDVVP